MSRSGGYVRQRPRSEKALWHKDFRQLGGGIRSDTLVLGTRDCSVRLNIAAVLEHLMTAGACRAKMLGGDVAAHIQCAGGNRLWVRSIDAGRFRQVAVANNKIGCYRSGRASGQSRMVQCRGCDSVAQEAEHNPHRIQDEQSGIRDEDEAWSPRFHAPIVFRVVTLFLGYGTGNP